MNYNTDLALWDTPECRQQFPVMGISTSGYVYANGEAVAAFPLKSDALATLHQAGWHYSRDTDHGYTLISTKPL